jgi:hypothetical protein
MMTSVCRHIEDFGVSMVRRTDSDRCEAIVTESLIARADSSELIRVSLIKDKVMGGAHGAISIHVDSSILK